MNRTHFSRQDSFAAATDSLSGAAPEFANEHKRAGIQAVIPGECCVFVLPEKQALVDCFDCANFAGGEAFAEIGVGILWWGCYRSDVAINLMSGGFCGSG